MDSFILRIDGKLARSDSGNKFLECWYFVFEGREKGIEVQFVGVGAPLFQVFIGTVGEQRSDSILNGSLCSTEITAEVICNGGFHN